VVALLADNFGTCHIKPACGTPPLRYTGKGAFDSRYSYLSSNPEAIKVKDVFALSHKPPYRIFVNLGWCVKQPDIKDQKA
jgi:hypothetical protein